MESILKASSQSTGVATRISDFLLRLFKGNPVACTVTGFVALVLYDQFKHRRYTRGMAGPRWTVPFIGGVECVLCVFSVRYQQILSCLWVA